MSEYHDLVTECDQCGLHDYDDNMVDMRLPADCDQCGKLEPPQDAIEIEDAEGVPTMTFCADCADALGGE